MKKVTDNRTGIAWKLQSKLEDIKFVDDMVENKRQKNQDIEK
jgi:hypothetical protein